MASITEILAALNERTIARRIGIPHDEARMRYRLERNTVRDFDEFSDRIGAYYNHHFSTCIAAGARLSRAEATGRAKETLDREYRRRHGDIVSAFTAAHDGLEGGMRVILDYIAEGIKYEAVERYVREVFDRQVAPNAWGVKVDIIRQFFRECGAYLSSSIHTDQPQRYAHAYQELIRSYVEGLQHTSNVFRRL